MQPLQETDPLSLSLSLSLPLFFCLFVGVQDIIELRSIAVDPDVLHFYWWE